MDNYKSGMKMQIGSKQKNTPSNFKEKDAMLMNHVDPGTDPTNSLGGNQMNEMMENMNEQYRSQHVLLDGKMFESGTGGYKALGEKVGNLLFPNAKKNKETREKARKEYPSNSQGYFSPQNVQKRVNKRAGKRVSRNIAKSIKKANKNK